MKCSVQNLEIKPFRLFVGIAEVCLSDYPITFLSDL